MSKPVRIALIIVGVLAVAIGGGPLIVPVPPLEGTVPAQQLADDHSRFFEVTIAGVEGVDIHYKEWGEGEPVMLLIHGFRGDLGGWGRVTQPLSEQGRVIAYDRVGFGLTERPFADEWQSGPGPYSDDAQVEAVIALLDALDVEQAVLIGNSAGGTVAAATALTHPDRVQALVLVDAAIYTGGGAPPFIQPLFQTAWFERPGLLIARAFGRSDGLLELSYHDPTRITEQDRADFDKLLQVEGWDRGLYEITKASQQADFDGQLADFTMPVLVMTGDDDRVVPTEDSLRLAEEIPGAQLAVLPDCGHVPQAECPQAFMTELTAFLDTLQE